MKLTPFWHQKMTLAPADGGAGGVPDPAAPANAAEPAAAVAPPPAAAAGPDLSWLPTDYVKDGAPDLDGFRAHYEGLAADAARRAEAVAGVPAAPDGYDLTAPVVDMTGLDLPEGFKFELAVDDPAVAPILDDMRATLHKHGLPKEAAQDFMGLLARYETNQYAKAAAAVREEMKTLGTSAPARIADVGRKIDTMLPADLATALKASMSTAKSVQAIEKLLGARNLAPAGAAPPQPKDDIEDYYRNPTR